jgi:hypothetical protein
MLSSEIWRRVALLRITDVSEGHIASILRVTRLSLRSSQPGCASRRTAKRTTCDGKTPSVVRHILASSWERILLPYRWRRYVPPKRRMFLLEPHGVISQKTVVFDPALSLHCHVLVRCCRNLIFVAVAAAASPFFHSLCFVVLSFLMYLGK